MLSTSTHRGVAHALVSSLMSACFLIPWKVATLHGDPKEATLVLLLVSAIFNTLTIPLTRSPETRDAPHTFSLTLWLAAAFALLSLAGNYFSAEAVQRLSGALLAVIQRCEVLVIALLGALFLGERVRPVFWLGTLVAGIGLVVLSQPSHDAAVHVDDADPLGALYGLGSAFCFGTMAVVTRRYIHQIRPVFLNATRLWLGFGLWFVVERRIPTNEQLPPGLLIGAALAGFFGPFLSRLFLMASARYIAAATTAILCLATPVLTLALSYFVLGTIPSERALLGGAIMLVGIAVPLLALLRERRTGG